MRQRKRKRRRENGTCNESVRPGVDGDRETKRTKINKAADPRRGSPARKREGGVAPYQIMLSPWLPRKRIIDNSCWQKDLGARWGKSSNRDHGIIYRRKVWMQFAAASAEVVWDFCWNLFLPFLRFT